MNIPKAGPQRGWGGPGAKLRNEARCERSGRKTGVSYLMTPSRPRGSRANCTLYSPPLGGLSKYVKFSGSPGIETLQKTVIMLRFCQTYLRLLTLYHTLQFYIWELCEIKELLRYESLSFVSRILKLMFLLLFSLAETARVQSE